MTTHVSPAAVAAAVPVQLPAVIDGTARTARPQASPSPTPAAKVPQDWEQLVTPGHVLGERLKRFGLISIPVGILCLFGAVQITRGAFDNLTYGMAASTPEAVAKFLYVDPDTFTDLGNGVRVSYAFHWLSAFNPHERGMATEQWQAINDATMADLNSHGFEAREWTAVAELGTQVTRPANVFTDHADKLAKGVIAFPEGEQAVHVLGYVEGAWAWNIYSAGFRGCGTLFGPQLDGCEVASLWNVSTEILSFEPQPQGEAEAEE